MQTSDKAEFDQRLAVLCAGFNIPVTAERAEAFWRGLGQMGIVQFARVVDSMLGEQNEEIDPRKLTVSVIWKQHRKLKTRPSASAAPRDPEDNRDHIDDMLNRIIFNLMRARGGFGSTGEVIGGRMVKAAPSPELRRVLKAKNATMHFMAQLMLEGDPGATGKMLVTDFISQLRLNDVMIPSAVEAAWRESAAKLTSPLPDFMRRERIPEQTSIDAVMHA